jgi:hemoglobin
LCSCAERAGRIWAQSLAINESGSAVLKNRQARADAFPVRRGTFAAYGDSSMPRFSRSAVVVALTYPLALGVLSVAVVGCKSDGMSSPKAAAMNQKSLYERLGGKPAITAVVDEFVARAASNPKANFTRKGHANEWDATPRNVEKLKGHLVAFVAWATGGSETYTGRDMASAHQGMGITDAEFDALAADLQASLQKFNVPMNEQNELMAIVGTTRQSIVGM